MFQQVAKNIEGCQILVYFLIFLQIWLNHLIDDCKFSYINIEIKNLEHYICPQLLMLTTRVRLLQFFPLSLPFALFICTFSSFALTTSQVRLPRSHVTLPGRMCQGSCSMLQTPHTTPKVPKTCMTWTQNMQKC